MPICYITLSESIKKPLTDEQLGKIRDIVAEGLDSKSRFLDRNHIAIRVQNSHRKHMLGEIEIDIFAQFYFRRFFTRDKRAKFISKKVSKIINNDCATWINLQIVGYSRVTTKGETFFSD